MPGWCKGPPKRERKHNRRCKGEAKMSQRLPFPTQLAASNMSCLIMLREWLQGALSRASPSFCYTATLLPLNQDKTEGDRPLTSSLLWQTLTITNEQLSAEHNILQCN